jgi:hypothetical protein
LRGRDRSAASQKKSSASVVATSTNHPLMIHVEILRSWPRLTASMKYGSRNRSTTPSTAMSRATSSASFSAIAAATAATTNPVTRTPSEASQKVLRPIRPSKLPKKYIHFITFRAASLRRAGSRLGAPWRQVLCFARESSRRTCCSGSCRTKRPRHQSAQVRREQSPAVVAPERSDTVRVFREL